MRVIIKLNQTEIPLSLLSFNAAIHMNKRDSVAKELGTKNLLARS